MIHGIPQNISRCGCADRPRCQMYGGSCGNYADGFAVVPGAVLSKPIRFTSKFTCASCWDHFYKAWTTPIPGWDRPEWADDEWKPSIDAVIDLALRKINDRARREYAEKMRESGLDLDMPMILQKGAKHTPEQLKQLKTLSRITREIRRSAA